MPSRERFHPAVATDLADAIDWHEERSEGLGTRFAAAADRRFNQILESPEVFPHAFPGCGLRFAMIPRFPYLVLYEVLGDMVSVLGVFHSATDPAKWRRRGRGG